MSKSTLKRKLSYEDEHESFGLEKSIDFQQYFDYCIDTPDIISSATETKNNDVAVLEEMFNRKDIEEEVKTLEEKVKTIEEKVKTIEELPKEEVKAIEELPIKKEKHVTFKSFEPEDLKAKRILKAKEKDCVLSKIRQTRGQKVEKEPITGYTHPDKPNDCFDEENEPFSRVAEGDFIHGTYKDANNNCPKFICSKFSKFRNEDSYYIDSIYTHSDHAIYYIVRDYPDETYRDIMYTFDKNCNDFIIVRINRNSINETIREPLIGARCLKQTVGKPYRCVPTLDIPLRDLGVQVPATIIQLPNVIGTYFNNGGEGYWITEPTEFYISRISGIIYPSMCHYTKNDKSLIDVYKKKNLYNYSIKKPHLTGIDNGQYIEIFDSIEQFPNFEEHDNIIFEEPSFCGMFPIVSDFVTKAKKCITDLVTQPKKEIQSNPTLQYCTARCKICFRIVSYYTNCTGCQRTLCMECCSKLCWILTNGQKGFYCRICGFYCIR